MLHQTTPPVPHWHDTLTAGDIVAFCFPHAEPSDTLTPARPCLVLALDADDVGARALLAYGTGRHTRAVRRPLEIAHIRGDDGTGSSLHRTIRFLCARRVWARLDDPAFDIAPDADTPVTGRLDGQAQARLATVLALLPRRAGRISATITASTRSRP